MLVLALRERASKESVVEEKVVEQGDLAIWLQQRFNGYFTVLVKIHLQLVHRHSDVLRINSLEYSGGNQDQ